MALLQEQLQNAKNRFEAGASSSFEVLRAEVALANAQPALIQARNAFRLAIEELRQALGFVNIEGDNLKKVPEFVGELKAEPTSFDLKSSLEAARTNRPELARLSKLEAAREQGRTTCWNMRRNNFDIYLRVLLETDWTCCQRASS